MLIQTKECAFCKCTFEKRYTESQFYWETKRKLCSRNCADSFAKGKPPWNKGKKYPQVTGSLNVKWKGGITPINEKIRKSFVYKLWRNAVFEKDNYTCQECGIRGDNLHADHIKPFAVYVDLRFAIDNGRALCVPCHKKTPTYGSYKINL